MATESFRFVVSSHARFKIFLFLSRKASTPTELAASTEKHLSHVSRALRELEDKKLVACVSSKYSKPRIYSLTPQGSLLVREVQKYHMRMRLV